MIFFVSWLQVVEVAVHVVADVHPLRQGILVDDEYRLVQLLHADFEVEDLGCYVHLDEGTPLFVLAHGSDLARVGGLLIRVYERAELIFVFSKILHYYFAELFLAAFAPL